MSNSFYTHGSFPSTGSAATSAGMRAELDLVTAGFDKLPTLAGNANALIAVNASASALTAVSPAAFVLGVSDTNFTIQNSADSTKKFQFLASGITAGSTRIYTMPDSDQTLVGRDTTDTLTNKTLTSPTIATIVNTGTLTLPTNTDTLVGRDTTDTLTNKTLTSPTIATIVNSGTLTLPTSTDTLVGRDTTDTLTNKTLTSPTIATIVNTGTLTLPTNTDTLVGRDTTDTLTNKTLTTPVISSISNSGTITLPTGTRTLVARDTTDTLTNKTLTTPIISSISNTGTLTLPTSTDTLVGRDTTDTLTNKSISGATNTLSNIANASLTNSSVTVGTTAISLGGTSLTLGGLTSVAVTADPTLALQLATKQYVDTQVTTGLSFHDPVQASTTGTLASITGGTVTYANGTAGVGATLTLSVALSTLDGYTLLNTNRILVKDEVAGANNGVYTWATGGTVLTRATDADTYGTGAGDIRQNAYFFTQNGTVNKGNSYVITTVGTITFGTTSITFAQFSGSQTYTASTGLTLTGTAFSIDSTVATLTGTQTLTNKTMTGAALNGTIGATTASTGAFTTLSASSTVSGTGFSTYLASPPAIGGTTAAAGAFTTLSASSTVSGTGFSTYLASPPAIGGTTAAAGTFTTLTATGAVALSPVNLNVVLSPTGTGVVTINPATAGTINRMSIGATTASTGAFTTLSATGNTTLGDAVTDTMTFNGQFVTGTVLRSAQTATNTLALAAYDTDGAAYTNLITLTASTTPTLALTSTGVGTINNMSVGATTASTGAFTTLSASSTVSGTGFSTYLASPPAIGGTTAAAGSFTSLTSTSASGILTRAAATQDGVEFIGRAGGTTSLKVTFTPTTLTASRTLTLPDNTGTLLTTGAVVTVAQGGTGQTTAGAAFNALSPITSTGDLIIGNGVNSATRLGIGLNGYILSSNGTTASWTAPAVGGASISNDTATSTNVYPLFAAATSGTPTTIYTGNAKYLYKPSTGELTSSAMISSNGIQINANTIATSYTIATGNNGLSAGPVSVSTGITVTVSTGSVWTVV